MTIPIYHVHQFPLDIQQIENLAKFDDIEMQYSWDKKAWENLNSGQEINYFLSTLDHGHEISAFSLYSISFEQAHLLKIAVRQSARNQGMATSILESDFSQLKELGVNEIYLEVSTANKAANLFYKKNGFEILTVKKKFYSDGIDANAMSLQLK